MQQKLKDGYLQLMSLFARNIFSFAFITDFMSKEGDLGQTTNVNTSIH
jgi:hypothetical protein